MANEKKGNLASDIYNQHIEEGMTQKQAYSATGRDLNKINAKNQRQKASENFKDSDIYKLMAEDGVKSEWYSNPVKWDCSRNGQQYVFEMNTDPDGAKRDPRIEIFVNAKKGVELSDKDILSCIQDVCDDFHVVKAANSFEDIGLTNDYPGDPCIVQVDYFHHNGIVNEKAGADLYVSVIDQNKVPELKEGRVGFAKLLCEAKNDIEIACKYLNRELPEQEKSVVSDLDKKKEATTKTAPKKTSRARTASKAKTATKKQPAKKKSDISID